MIVTHKIKMDLTRRGTTPRIEVVQDDKYSRNLAVCLYDSGKPWVPEAGVAAMVNYVKPDGTGGSYNFLPDETRAWWIQGNVVTVALAPQVCTVPGRIRLGISLFRDAVELNTFAIELDVRSKPGLLVRSEDYFKRSDTLPNFGWDAGKLLGTDAGGNVVAVDYPDTGVHTVNGLEPDAAGDITISCTALPRPAAAQVGQYLRVRAVDAGGQVTAVEAVDLNLGDPVANRFGEAKLPVLPDQEEIKNYPYHYLGMGGDPVVYRYYASGSPLYYDADNGYTCSATGGAFTCKYTETDGVRAWSVSTASGDREWSIGALISKQLPPIWANYDMRDLDGNVCVAASDSALVYGSGDSAGGMAQIVLSTPFSWAGVTLGEEDVAQLAAVAADGSPFCARIGVYSDGVETGVLKPVFSSWSADGQLVYTAHTFDGTQLMVLIMGQLEEGGWILMGGSLLDYLVGNA